MLEAIATLTDFALGLAVGVLAGMLGVGGGIVLVPALTLAMGVSQHSAQGVSLVAIVPTALVGAVAHRRAGNLALWVAIAVGTVSVAAAVLGAYLSGLVDSGLLRRAFGVLLVVMAISILQTRGSRTQSGWRCACTSRWS